MSQGGCRGGSEEQPPHTLLLDRVFSARWITPPPPGEESGRRIWSGSWTPGSSSPVAGGRKAQQERWEGREGGGVVGGGNFSGTSSNLNFPAQRCACVSAAGGPCPSS